MPEFMQNAEDIYQKIIVSFDTEEDVAKFAKLINQQITEKTHSIRIPYRPINKTTEEWSNEN